MLRLQNLRSILVFLTIFLTILALLGFPRNASATSESQTDFLQFASEGHILGFSQQGVYAATGSHALHIEFIDSNLVKPYSIPISGVGGSLKTLNSVEYQNLWDGISLTYSSGGVFTTSYVINPGADVNDIQLKYNTPVELNKNGFLIITFESGSFTESAPIAWQVINGKNVAVNVEFNVHGSMVTFKVDKYDRSQPLYIDPTLTWNTFLGGSDSDIGYSIVVDNSGNTYVAGTSSSSWGSPVRAFSGNSSDAFVAKLSPSGSLLWNTFLGGNSDDQGYSVSISNGSLYVIGQSSSTWGSPSRGYSGGGDAFVAGLNAGSGSLTWNTFLGGTGTDSGNSIYAYGTNIYLAGSSYTSWGNPVRSHVASWDTFIAELDLLGALQWNTFLGGNGADYGKSIIVSGVNEIYVTGDSNDSWGVPVRAFSHLAGAYYYNDAFVAKLNSSGGLIWNTFLGGSGYDVGSSIATDSVNVIVVGRSSDPWGSPIRAFSHPIGSSFYDAFAAKLDSEGNVVWNTFLGGDGNDYGYEIVLGEGGDLYITGESGDWGNPIITYSGFHDAFVAKVGSSGTLLWNAFVGGGDSHDIGYSIAVDGDENVYITGGSDNAWGSPIRNFSSSGVPGDYDAFIAVVPAPTDTTPPTISSILRISNSPVSSDYVDYTVTFSESVTNLTTSDFSLTTTGITGASVSSVSGSGSTYTVSVSTGTGNGTLRLDIPSSATIADTYGNSLSNLPFTSGEVYSILRDQTFGDVTTTYWAWQYIERLYNAGITGGCTTSPLSYCPANLVTRAQMAIFLEKGIHGSSFTPPDVASTFTDTAGHWAEDWIETLKNDGITSGCGTGIYCPDSSVTRAQMAVFLLKSKHGSSYTPPSATGVFSDVATTYWAAAWIEQLAVEGVTSGCASGLYCPDNSVTRDQMAVFLVKAFNLP